MNLKYTAGSRIHKSLNALKICPLEPAELKKKIDCQDSVPRMMEEVISPAMKDGLIVRKGNVLELTQRGLDKLLELGPIKKVLKPLQKLSKMEGVYDGAELKNVSSRPGAYDFLNCPSLIGDRRYERQER